MPVRFNSSTPLQILGLVLPLRGALESHAMKANTVQEDFKD